MNVRRLVLPMVGGVLGLLLSTSAGGQERVGPAGPSETEQSIRSSIGLPKIPSEPATIAIGAVKLTLAEAALYDTDDKSKRAAASQIKTLLGRRDVVSVSYSGKITDPSITLWMDSNSSDLAYPELDALKSLGFTVKRARLAYTKEDYLEARDAASSLLYGIDTSVSDIDPQVKQELSREDRRATSSAADGVRQLLNELATSGIKVTGSLYPGIDPKIQLQVAPGDLNRAAETVRTTKTGLAALIDIVPTSGEQLAQAGGPWDPGFYNSTWSGRLATESLGRGGKRLSVDPAGGFAGQSCTTGAVVQDSQSGTDYILSAGHCDNDYTYTVQRTGSTAGVPLQLFAACNISENPNCAPPQTYGGIDASLWKVRIPYNNTLTGWHVWQEWPGDTAYQTRAYSVYTSGSYDLVAGDPMTCIEGASLHKFGTSISAATSCGIAAGWSGGGFFVVSMYPHQPVCRGDSGGYVRKPTNSTGSWNAGTFRSMESSDSSLTLVSGLPCHMRLTDSSPDVRSLVTTFYKTHLWISVGSGNTISIWAKTY